MGIRIGLGLSPVLAADRLPWTPGELSSLRAWYDAELGQPKYGGDGAYVQLDGTSGDYIFTPDSAATSFSNDIEVVMRVKVTDWTAAANQTLAGKYVSTGNQRSWRFYVNTSGAIGLTASTDGTAVTSVIVTPTNALPDNTWIWLRMRLDLTNGSNSVGTLETATDTGDNTEPSSWTANGTNTGTTISGIFDSTSPTEIGTFGSGTLERMTGQVGRCIVRSGFDGTTVADFNASDCYGPGYTHSGGYRWTLGLPKIYDRSGNNVAPATFGSGSNQPLWLPWEGSARVYLPGVAGNYISCPDANSLDITGDIDMRVHVANWDTRSATRQVLVAKYTTEGYRFDSFDATRWIFVMSGGTLLLMNKTVSGLFTGWIRVTRAAASGAVVVSTSTDNVNWTTDVSGTLAAGSAFAVNAAALEIGSSLSGASSPFVGSVRAAQVRDGINGTLVADFNAELCGQSGYTDAYSNVWTVNRSTTGRKTVVQSPAAGSARAVILHGTDDWIDVPAAAVPALDTFAAASSVTASFRRWHNPGALGHPIFTTKANSPNVSLGTNIRLTTTAASTNLATYAGDGAGADFLDPYTAAAALGVRDVVALQVGNADPFVSIRSNGSAASTDSVRNSTVTTSTGGAGRIGAYLAGGAPIDMEFEALICRDVAPTDTEHGLQVAYYGGDL